MGVTIFYATLSFDNNLPVLLIFVFSITLHLFFPLRAPEKVLWPLDSPFYFQLVKNTVGSGYWALGYGTGPGVGYSLFPVSGIFASIMNEISAVPLLPIIKYVPAFLNPMFLLGFYVLANRLLTLDIKQRNLILLMFSLNSTFHAKDSDFCAESYAIIFFPLVLFLALARRGPGRIKHADSLLVCFLLVITMTHHFTSYMIVITLIIPSIVLYVLFRKSIANAYVLVLSIVAPLAWLTLAAISLFISHTNLFLSASRNMAFTFKPTGYVATEASVYYSSSFTAQWTTLSQTVLISLVLLGLVYILRTFRHRRDQEGLEKKSVFLYFTVLLLLFSFLQAIFLFGIDWLRAGPVDMRTRLTIFFFVPAAIFSASGMYFIVSKLREPSRGFLQIPLMLMLSSILTLLFIPPLIFQAFPRYIYESEYVPILADELTLSSMEKYAIGLWIGQHVNSTKEYSFVVSHELKRYVMARGNQGDIRTDEEVEISVNGNSSDFYLINYDNAVFPDRYGHKLDRSTIQFLDEKDHKIYDNGLIGSYLSNHGP